MYDCKQFSKDSIYFESPTCAKDRVKAILSLVPENEWEHWIFDVSSAYFQGDSLERDVYVKNGPGFWLLNVRGSIIGLRGKDNRSSPI